MKACFLFPILLLSLIHLQDIAVTDGSQLVVLEQKWSRERLNSEQAESAFVPPVAAVITPNKVFERNRRDNIVSPAERDPNLDTVDGRSAALEKSVEESRAAKPKDGYAYQVRVKNSSPKKIDTVFWEYQFKESAGSEYSSRRQFFCEVSIKPDKEKDLKGFSLSGPSDVVGVGALKKDLQKAFTEKVIINRIEFTDGTTWQRKDWKAEEIRLSYSRALKTPWVSDMCKAL